MDPIYFFLDEERKQYPNGNFNLGLSHGITGVMVFLSIAMIQGIKIEGQKKALEMIASWIEKKQKKIDGRFFWDYSISFEEEISGFSAVKSKSRDAWCYGTPGVSRSLYLAGIALKNENLKTCAFEAFISIFKSSPNDWDLSGPTICHGIAGLLIITILMARDSESVLLTEETYKLRKILLSFYDPTFPLGFKHSETMKNKQQSYAWINKADLMEGTSGVLLTLLSLHTCNFRWHLPFLIDI